MPLTAIAASTARPMAARLRHRESAPTQVPSANITEAATNAPTAMKAPWPKFSTSIRPKVSVSPEAMIKIISPIARPATDNVTQLDHDPTSGNDAAASAGMSRRGRRSLFIGGASLVRIHAHAEQVLLQRGVGRERRHAAGVRHLAVVHHRDGIAQLAREGEVLLDHQQRRLAILQFAEGRD